MTFLIIAPYKYSYLLNEKEPVFGPLICDVRQCVRPSVTFMNSFKTMKNIIEMSSPSCVMHLNYSSLFRTKRHGNIPMKTS